MGQWHRNKIYVPRRSRAPEECSEKSIPVPTRTPKSIFRHRVEHSGCVCRVIKANSGGQDDYIFTAPATKKYTFQTVGQLDTVMVISEKAATENYYLSGDDDSGLDKNSKITLPLVKGRDYLVNLRVMFTAGEECGSIIVS